MSTSAPACWWLYIVRTASGMLYTGITLDVSRRIGQHQRGNGAKALRGKGPLELLFHCKAGDHSQALKLEYQVKRLSKKTRIRLTEHQPASVEQWLASHNRSKGAANSMLPATSVNASSASL